MGLREPSPLGILRYEEWMSKWSVVALPLKPNVSSMSSPVKRPSVRVQRPRSHERPQKTDAVRP